MTIHPLISPIIGLSALISLSACGGMTGLNSGVYTDTGDTGDTGIATSTYWWTEYTDTGAPETTTTSSTVTTNTSTTTTSNTTTTTGTTSTTGTTGTTTTPGAFDGLYSGNFTLFYENIILGPDTCSGNGTLTIAESNTPPISSDLKCTWPIFSALSLIFTNATGNATGNYSADGSASGTLIVSDGAKLNISMNWSGTITGNQINGNFAGSDIFDSYSGTFSLSR